MTEQDCTILVCDDDPDIATQVKWILESSPFSVISCSTVDEALVTIRTGAVAVALLDLSMPGAGGYELLQKARLDKGIRGVQFVMLTGVDEYATAQDCFRMGACDYLVKPLNAEHLQCALSRALLHGENRTAFPD